MKPVDKKKQRNLLNTLVLRYEIIDENRLITKKKHRLSKEMQAKVDLLNEMQQPSQLISYFIETENYREAKALYDKFLAKQQAEYEATMLEYSEEVEYPDLYDTEPVDEENMTFEERARRMFGDID